MDKGGTPGFHNFTRKRRVGFNYGHGNGGFKQSELPIHSMKIPANWTNSYINKNKYLLYLPVPCTSPARPLNSDDLWHDLYNDTSSLRGVVWCWRWTGSPPPSLPLQLRAAQRPYPGPAICDSAPETAARNLPPRCSARSARFLGSRRCPSVVVRAPPNVSACAERARCDGRRACGSRRSRAVCLEWSRDTRTENSPTRLKPEKKEIN